MAGLLLGGGLTAAHAQEPEAGCAQGRISRIFVDNHSVFDLSDPELNPRFAWAYRMANRFHPATRAGVIRRELLFDEGDCYDVERLRDSERLLRALAFIADVDIFGVRQADGSIHVLVDTRDEWSLRVDAAVGGGGESGLTSLRLRENNLLGSGNHVSGFYRNRQGERVYGGAFFTPQLFDTRWDATLEAGKTPLGVLFAEEISYPFVGDVGRWAFHQEVLRNDRYFEYLAPSGDRNLRIWFPERRISFGVGGGHRWGKHRHSQTVLGAALSGEWITYPEEPRYEDDAKLPLDPPPLPPTDRDSISSVWAMLLLGQRNIYYVRRRGLDTVRGTEDVRLGVESQMALGPSVPLLSDDRNLALGLRLFAAGEMTRAGIVGTDLRVEARREYDTPVNRSEWSDIFAQLNSWAYLRPERDPGGVWVASVAGAGGWDVRVPFQLTLGSQSGLRGYRAHLTPGARRVVGSLEHRRYLGWPLPDLFDLGAVAFVDAGKIWAGDVPYGETSPIRADVGVGLRAAFPPGSRQTLRLDIGVPLADGVTFRDVVLSVGMGQIIGLRSTRRDFQLGRSVHPGISPTLLAFPASR